MCSFWAQCGECDRNPTFMRRCCQQSCHCCPSSQASNQPYNNQPNNIAADNYKAKAAVVVNQQQTTGNNKKTNCQDLKVSSHIIFWAAMTMIPSAQFGSKRGNVCLKKMK